MLNRTTFKFKSLTKLLLVEDDPEYAFLVKRAFNAIKGDLVYLLDHVESVDAGLLKLKERAYDAVILDYHLGGDTALDFVSHIPARLSSLALVVLTGSDGREEDAISFGLGVDFFLNKDELNKRTLERAVRYAIRNRSQQQRLRNFSRILAHDFKGPLSTMKALTGLLNEDGDCPDDLEQAKVVELVDSECGRLINLVNDLEAYSVSQSAEFKGEGVALGALLGEVVKGLETEMAERSAKVVLADIPEIEIPSDMMLHVFQNLIQNGLKYNRSSKPEVRVEAIAETDRVVVRVSDNGIGIAQEHAAKVFEPMVRLHGSGEFKGTGLGLAVCREIVERHRGRIWIETSSEDAESVGTTFVLELPHVAEVAQHSAPLVM